MQRVFRTDQPSAIAGATNSDAERAERDHWLGVIDHCATRDGVTRDALINELEMLLGRRGQITRDAVENASFAAKLHSRPVPHPDAAQYHSPARTDVAAHQDDDSDDAFRAALARRDGGAL